MHKPASRLDNRSRYRIHALLLSGLFLAACQSAPDIRSPEPLAPVPAMPDAPVFRVDERVSQLRVLAYSAGPLARFGHNHVLVAPLYGVIHAGKTAAGSGFQLRVNVADFDIDPPAARAEEGKRFSATVPDDAREGTRQNMLGAKLLDAENHPHIVIESMRLEGSRRNPQVTARVRLRDREQDVEFPAAVFEQDGQLSVTATFTLRQSAFGIEPFSVLGGGLQVDDALDVRVRIVASRNND